MRPPMLPLRHAGIQRFEDGRQLDLGHSNHGLGWVKLRLVGFFVQTGRRGVKKDFYCHICAEKGR